MVNENLHLTLCEVKDIVGVSHITVQIHLQAEGYVYRAGMWVLYNLNERQLTQRTLVYDQRKEQKTTSAEIYRR